MADTHPYISGPGNVAQMIARLRKAFPGSINAETVKKHGLAPNNESYVINVLQFIGVIDADGKKTPEAVKIFSRNDEEFAQGFEGLVKKAYSSLFELHGEHAWVLDNGDLVTFFRQSDQTSDAIGKRQAGTFRVLAGLSGHGDLPELKTPKSPKTTKLATVVRPKQKKVHEPSQKDPVGDVKSLAGSGVPLGLTVRVEINLPADGNKETYDNIFKSIKENLLGG